MRRPAPPSTRMGPDGAIRTLDEERRINILVSDALKAGAGSAVLEYLKSITTGMSVGPNNLDPYMLAHREGQRFIVSVLDQRLRMGLAGEPKSEETPK